MDFFGGHQRETLPEIEPKLPAKHRPGANARAVTFVESIVDNVLHQVEIGFHSAFLR